MKQDYLEETVGMLLMQVTQLLVHLGLRSRLLATLHARRLRNALDVTVLLVLMMFSLFDHWSLNFRVIFVLTRAFFILQEKATEECLLTI